MNDFEPFPSVVLITDPRHSDARIEAVLREAARVLGPRKLLVQLRDKIATDARLVVRARRLRAIADEVDALFVVNGSVAIAREVSADGVHLPKAIDLGEARRILGNKALLSTSAHTDDDVRIAVREGATMVLVSPIYDSPGKGAARGEDALRTARTIVDDAAAYTRIVALGGVTDDRSQACRSAGAHGVAVIRALLDHPAEVDATGLREVVRRMAEPFRED